MMDPDEHMDADGYQQAWQAQTSQTRVTIDADLLLKAVQRNQQELRAAIVFRDLSEIGSSLVLLPVWIVLGVTAASPWTFYLMLPVFIWSIGFTLVVRARQKRKPSEPGEPLLKSVKESLGLVEHQIWWMRSRFWWSELPTAIAMLAFLAHVSWLKARNWLDALSDVNAFVFVLFLALFYYVYYMNQRVLSTQYEPRRQELLTLLASLRDDTTSEVSGEYPILMSEERVTNSCSPRLMFDAILKSEKRVECSTRRMFVAGLCFVVLLLIGIAGILIASSLDQDYPKKSPFAAVRWQQSQPEVKVGDEWFKLLSLDELPAFEIVAFSKRTYGNNWRKRFEEDLVELLTRMGHPPQDTVMLDVQSLTSQEMQTLEDIPMTTANRRNIWDAAQARERDEQEQESRRTGA